MPHLIEFRANDECRMTRLRFATARQANDDKSWR